MKKLLSILIAAALLLSITVSAFAADTDGATLTVGSATAEIGDEVTLEVTMSETKYAAYGLQITYDATGLELVSIDEGDEALKFFTANTTTGKVTDFSNKDTKVDGVIFTITFNVLSAGEHTVSVVIDSFNMADQSELEVSVVDGVISVAGGEEPEVPTDPEVIYEGSMGVETTDTYGYFDLFSMTAPVTGTYTINVPAGLGLWSEESYLNWGNPEIDFYDNTEGYSFTLELTEGEVFAFYVGATTKSEWTITYTVTENTEGGEGGEGGNEGGIPTGAVDLTIGNISINAADVTYVYTAPTAGTLILNMGNSIMGPVEAEVTVNFANAQTLSAMQRIELALNAGDVVLVAVTATGYATMTAEWDVGGEDVECEHEFVEGVCVLCGEEDPNYNPTPVEPDGTAGNPFIVEQLPAEFVQETTDDIYYQWTATEAGTLYMYYVDGMCTLSGSSVGSWEYADGGKYIEVAAGDVITINYWSGTGFSLEFVVFSGEAESGTLANPIVIETTSITLTIADSELYYAWTVTEAGTVVIKITECTWSYGYNLMVNGEALFGAGSEMTIEVEAGDQILVMIDVYPSASSDGYLVLEIAQAEHVCDFVITETVDATCTEPGYVVYTCACGESYTEEIPALGHSYEAVVTEPTCVDAGFTTYTCATCGDSYVADEVAALGHSWDEGVVTVEPTEEADGEKLYTCTLCGETKTEVIPALEHVHQYDASYVVEPTCTQQGYTLRECRCGDMITEDYVDALGHDYEGVVTDPTCVDAGFTTYTCTRCEDTYVADEVAALGHSWDEGVVTVEPTEEAEGEKLYTCANCGETKTEVIPALGHVHSYEAVVTAPTCVDAGYTTYTCACGDSYVADEVAALGHTYEVTDSKEATCAEAGYVIYTCSCGDTYTEEIPATGEHVYENGACTNCGAEDPNPGTGGMNVMAIALIAMMSVTAVVVTANKKSDEE